MKTTKFLVVALVTVLSSHSVPLNAKGKGFEFSELTQGVAISSETPLPEKLHWMGRGQAAGAGAFGLIGAAAGGDMADKDREKLRALLDDNNIDVGKMIADAFASKLLEKGIASSYSQESQYQVSFRFKEVGLHASMNIGSSKMKPYIGVVATMTDGDGNELWKKHALVTNLSGKTKGHPKKKIMKDPKLLRTSMQEAADEIAALLMRDFEKAGT